VQDKELDLDGLQIEEATIKTWRPTSKLRRRRHGRFTPMPDEWLPRLTNTTALVALYLQHLAFKEHRQVVKLANGPLTLQGVSRLQKRRALIELEALGLISVERRARKSPIITLL
jgi:hypothetical protein